MDELTSESEIEIRSPVTAGDLLAIPLEDGDVVAIVDGYFHQRRAIPHKEIMEIMSRGVRVLGASSMGALRAAELEPFGMQGVGQIFADYRSRLLCADDEVTLIHGTAECGYPRFSEPLVNMRATLDGAVAAGVCSSSQARDVVEYLRKLPYRKRNWNDIALHLCEMDISKRLLKEIVDYCWEHPVDRKRDDAIELVRLLLAGEMEPDYVAVSKPEATLYLYEWKAAAEDVDTHATHAFAQVLAPDYPTFYERVVLSWLVSRCEEECSSSQGRKDGHVRLTELAVEHGAHKGLYAPELDDLGFLKQWTTGAERAACTETELLSKFLVRSCRIRPGIVHTELAAREFRRLEAHERAVALVPRTISLNELGRAHRPDFDHERMAADQVATWLASRWDWPAEDLLLAAYDRGFGSVDALITAARQVYLAAQCDAAVTNYALGE
ncbi:TfuA-like protein [Streptomyces olivaceus]|uniref:TfuA-like protein n=1 Tax=Streptomyces olivaceus TaxID=47716 RepID=UPI003676BBBC